MTTNVRSVNVHICERLCIAEKYKFWEKGGEREDESISYHSTFLSFSMFYVRRKKGYIKMIYKVSAWDFGRVIKKIGWILTQEMIWGNCRGY